MENKNKNQKLAVFESGGKQYLVNEGEKLKTEKLPYLEGQEFELDKVLLIQKGREIKIGQPYLEGAKILSKVLKQGKERKKIVFKFKPKVRYKKKRGHRQLFTQIQILKILG